MANHNQKTQTLLNMVQDAIRNGQYEIEPSALQELFSGPDRANVFAKIPMLFRKDSKKRGPLDWMTIHEAVAAHDFDTNFKGIVGRAYRDQKGKRDQRKQDARGETPGRSPEQAVQALCGRVTTASALAGAGRTNRGRGDSR